MMSSDVDILLLQEHCKVKIALKHEMLISSIATILNSGDSFFETIEEALSSITDALAINDTQFISFDNAINSNIKNKKWLNICYEQNTEKHLTSSINTHISESRPIFWNELSELLEINRKSLLERNINAFAAFPLKIKHKVAGIITFEGSESNIWTPKHYSLFGTLASLIASFYDKYAQTEARLDAEKKNAEVIQTIGNSARLASIGVMAAGITHEINQPLNAIKVLSEGILFYHKRNPVHYDKDLIQKIKDISTAADRINEIVMQMKSFCDIASSTIDDEFEVNQTIHYALEFVKNLSQIHDIEIELTLYPYKVFLKGNKVHFEQIIINLCINAIQALEKIKKEDKKIVISSEIVSSNQTKQKCLILTISDNGTGILCEDLNRIFDPFYSTKSSGENMGLGLAIVKMFVDSFKGKIIAMNKENKEGASFQLMIDLPSK